MALFKLFHGEEKELNEQIPIVEGRNYFLVDSGKLFVDTPQERICLNAENADTATALKDNDKEFTAKDLVKVTDTISIANGGTEAKTLAEARLNLQIDRTIATIIPIPEESWVENAGKFSQIINLPTLTCGAAGNVPPIVSLASDDSIQFSLLESIEADITAHTLTLVARTKPSKVFTIIVTDHT